jgi:hypothetical protein
MKLLSKEKDIRTIREQYRIRDEILKDRLENLMPRLMKECGVEMWMVIGREYNEDPVFKTLVPSHVKTASRLSCLVFSLDKDGKYEAINLSRPDPRLSPYYIHAYTTKEKAVRDLAQCCHPLRLLDVFDCYGEFGLPIHISETSIPSFTNEPADEALQAELTKRLMKLWFGRKHCESVVWWNLADNTAYHTENQYHAGLLREDCSEKPAYRVMDDLINREWHTEFSRNCTSELRFSGFYGNYEITVTANGHTSTHTVRLYRDTMGYDNRRCDFRSVTLTV